MYQTQHDLIVQNKIENLQANIDAIKGLKQINLLDNEDSNDNDVDMIIPNPPVNLASFDELKQAELRSFHNELVKENNDEIDRILSEYPDFNSDNYAIKDSHIVNIHTGEVISDYVEPIPTGPIDKASMTESEKAELERFYREHPFPGSNTNNRYGYFDEAEDSELF